MECLKIHDIVREPVKLSFLYIKRTDPYVKVNGGGFSGTILAFVKTSRLKDYVAYMDSILGKGSCHVIHTREQGAIRLL